MKLEITVDDRKVVEFFRSVNAQWKPTLFDLSFRIGEALVRKARRRAPVRTGRLRKSIFAKASERGLFLGADAPYASFVEYGTRYMRPRSFLRPAISEAEREMERMAGEIISDLFERLEA